MKIIQLVTKRQFRGAEVFAAQLSKDLIDLNHEIVWIGLYENKNLSLNVEGAKSYDLMSKKAYFFSLKGLFSLIKILKHENPDVIQSNGSDTLKYAVIASFFVNRIPITYRNISIISMWLNSSIKKVFYRLLFSKVDYVTSVGNYSRIDFINAINFNPSKVEVIRRGIPINKVDVILNNFNIKNKYNLKETDQLLVHVGNFSPEKNHIFLIDVMNEIKKTNQSIKLICLGEGVLFNYFSEEIKKNQLEDTIYLFGFCNSPQQVIKQSKVLLLCSKIEGVPGVILEAAAHKIPSVASNVGGIREIVIDSETGFLINNFDIMNFAMKILTLINNEKLAKKMGEKAYEILVNEFDPKTNALKFVNLYNQLIKENKR